MRFFNDVLGFVFKGVVSLSFDSPVETDVVRRFPTTTKDFVNRKEDVYCKNSSKSDSLIFMRKKTITRTKIMTERQLTGESHTLTGRRVNSTLEISVI